MKTLSNIINYFMFSFPEKPTVTTFAMNRAESQKETTKDVFKYTVFATLISFTFWLLLSYITRSNLPLIAFGALYMLDYWVVQPLNLLSFKHIYYRNRRIYIFLFTTSFLLIVSLNIMALMGHNLLPRTHGQLMFFFGCFTTYYMAFISIYYKSAYRFKRITDTMMVEINNLCKLNSENRSQNTSGKKQKRKTAQKTKAKTQAEKKKSYKRKDPPPKTSRPVPLNFYNILDIPFDASNTQIKKAYYSKIKTFHPDRHAHERTSIRDQVLHFSQKLNEAYSILSNREKRKEYDRKISA